MRETRKERETSSHCAYDAMHIENYNELTTNTYKCMHMCMYVCTYIAVATCV